MGLLAEGREKRPATTAPELFPSETARRHKPDADPPREYPFFSLGVGVTALLAFFATPFSAMLFFFVFVFSYGIRRWLLGVIPEASGVSVFSLVLGVSQVFVAALLIARWSASGCVSLTPAPLLVLVSAQMVSSLLPRPLPFALSSASLALVLLQAYASWAPPLCAHANAEPAAPRVSSTAPHPSSP